MHSSSKSALCFSLPVLWRVDYPVKPRALFKLFKRFESHWTGWLFAPRSAQIISLSLWVLKLGFLFPDFPGLAAVAQPVRFIRCSWPETQMHRRGRGPEPHRRISEEILGQAEHVRNPRCAAGQPHVRAGGRRDERCDEHPGPVTLGILVSTTCAAFVFLPIPGFIGLMFGLKD